MAAKKRNAKKTDEKKAAPKKTEQKKEEVPELSEEQVESLQGALDELKDELDKSMRFAAASKRARKMTTNLEKEFKAFRKASVAYWKKD